ncbi:MAG TPA: hypothetical protein VJN43_00925 [Bryobacteraceae bacterium]|nr:hypothetical protein [Bryobacteraceae bacterium]
MRPAHILLGLLTAVCAHGQTAVYLDLAPFGRTETAAHGASREITIAWDEERDVREINARFAAAAPANATVEYWFRNWPYSPPRMPSIEDPVDDPWQGKWVTAQTTQQCHASECSYDFRPLAESENPLAKNLPGVRYRRTLKVRLTYSAGAGTPPALQVFSESKPKPLTVRVELGRGEKSAAEWNGAVEVFNGILRSTKPWGFQAGDAFESAAKWNLRTSSKPKGLMLELTASDPAPPGSNDVTIVTIKAQAATPQGSSARSFSFSTADLKRGSIAIPAVYAYVDSPAPPAPRKQRIRRMIPQEPEQTYERASHEIPALDPWNRESGGAVYLPLAADSSWQKFAFEYGGNVFISKHGTKAKGRELARLEWEGDRIAWKIGTGETPYYREDHKCSVSVLDGYLPVVTQRWQNEGLEYTEEAFATLLRGPLSPDDTGRDEETPAILMLRLTAENRSATARTAHFSISLDPGEQLAVNGKRVESIGNAAGRYAAPRLRAVLDAEGGESRAGLARVALNVPVGGSKSLVIKLPFVSDLNAQEAAGLEALDYDSQRSRVVAYWKEIVRPTTRFSVPEPKFNDLARSVIPHIHISTTKDPKSGLYMVPAASYFYDVFENEACFQALLLDTLGAKKTVDAYLEMMLELQGSRNFPGLHTGPIDAIFHGARVNEAYDYTAHHYGLDHPTVLWTLAEHYLYTRDRQWLEHAWPHMEKAADWIIRQRNSTRRTGPGGQRVREYGLLPASQLEDNPDWANWFAINAYAWAALDRTAQALRDAKFQDADRMAREADSYKKDLREAVIRASEASPTARMRDGIYEPYVPVEPFRRLRLFGPLRTAYYTRYNRPDVKPLFRLSADREGLYGPMILLNLGLFGANEGIADWILDDWEDNQTLTSGLGLNVHGLTDEKLWFSQGGMVFQANLQNPIQVYLKRHEIPAAIRAIYNNFVACFYPDVNAFTEEYHQWVYASGPFYKIPDEARFVNRLRDMLVLEDGDSLWLASGTPRRWLESKEGVHVSNVITYFGPVSYDLHAGSQPGVVEASIDLPRRNPARTVWLVARTPGQHIRSVTINGRAWTKIDAAKEAIELPQDQGRLQVQIRY